MANIHDSREEIDRLDRQLVRLLAERMRAVRSIGAFKRENPSSPLRDEERERALFETWARDAEQVGLSPYFVGRVLREILNYSRRDQERLLDDGGDAGTDLRTVRVGYPGVPASDADLTIAKLAVSRAMGRVTSVGLAGYAAVLDALLAGSLDYALLPIENSLAGSINDVYDLLTRRPVTIVGEEQWQVEHCLVGVAGASVEGIRAVRSHPVALQQCQGFLDGLVGCRMESVADTAAAAKSVGVDANPQVAAIASEEAARHWGLAVLRREIADHPVNTTRFVLVASQPEPIDPRLPSKSSLVLAVSHRHGALLACLQALERHGINITKLESRPQPSAPWEYLFYLDIEGHTSDPRVASAVEELRHHTNHVKMLGSYPRRLEEVERERIRLGVSEAPTAEPPPRASRKAAAPPGKDSDQERATVWVGGVPVGGESFVIIAGPPAAMRPRQIADAAAALKRQGVPVLRAGMLGSHLAAEPSRDQEQTALEALVEAGRAYEMPVVAEVVRPEDVDLLARSVEMLQIGARNMQNQGLLRAVGHCHCPILLRRALSATVEELLQSAATIMEQGNQRVVLCERGIRTFETATRSTLDLSAVALLRSLSHLPVLVDPTHAAGSPALVVSLSLAAAAAGADGLVLLVETEPAQEQRPAQALSLDQFQELRTSLQPILAASGRTLR